MVAHYIYNFEVAEYADSLGKRQRIEKDRNSSSNDLSS